MPKDTARSLPQAQRPCAECPWRVDVEPGQFPAHRYDALQGTVGTAGQEAPTGAPMFACHVSPEGRERACAGWLAVAGRDPPRCAGRRGYRSHPGRRARPRRGLAGAAPQLRRDGSRESGTGYQPAGRKHSLVDVRGDPRWTVH